MERSGLKNLKRIVLQTNKKLKCRRGSGVARFEIADCRFGNHAQIVYDESAAAPQSPSINVNPFLIGQ